MGRSEKMFRRVYGNTDTESRTNAILDRCHAYEETGNATSLKNRARAHQSAHDTSGEKILDLA